MGYETWNGIALSRWYLKATSIAPEYCKKKTGENMPLFYANLTVRHLSSLCANMQDFCPSRRTIWACPLKLCIHHKCARLHIAPHHCRWNLWIFGTLKPFYLPELLPTAQFADLRFGSLEGADRDSNVNDRYLWAITCRWESVRWRDGRTAGTLLLLFSKNRHWKYGSNSIRRRRHRCGVWWNY